MVLGGVVGRLGHRGPPVFDGAGVPWVLTGTHQRDASSSGLDDGDIRAPTLCGWCCHGHHVVMVVSESLFVLPSNTPPLPGTRVALLGRLERWLHSYASRRRRDQLLSFCGKSSSSCPPTPPRPSTHRQLSAHRPARLHAVSSRSPFCHLRPTSLADLFASSETCIQSPMFFGTCGLFSSRPRGRIEDCSFFQMMYIFSVGLVIGCPIISRFDDRHVPIICHVASTVLNSCNTPRNVRPSLRSPSQGSFWPPTWRLSCILCTHRLCDSSVACSVTCCSST